jgi:hypothetical protein
MLGWYGRPYGFNQFLISHSQILRSRCKKADSRALKTLVQNLYNKDWVVYTIKPFAGVNQLVRYLGRYSHRVAITNPGIISIDDQTVSFIYKDYKDNAKKKMMKLKGEEFIRRFCLHILPPRFRKVRPYGFTSNASKKESINKARIAPGLYMVILLNRKERKQKAKERIFDEPNQCPCCKVGKMQIIDATMGNKDPPFITNPFTIIKR